MKIVLASAFALAIMMISPSLAQSVGEKTGVNSALGIAPKTPDFVKEAAMSDLTEIAASKLGEERGNAKQKAFSAKMIEDHTKTSQQLKELVKQENMSGEVPTSLDSTHQSKIDKLRDAKPDDFSSDFNSMQMSAHKGAVSLFERYAKGGDNDKLKSWAAKTLPDLKHHLEMAQDLDKK
ncbi:putative membrane protein [Nitrobacteraceae bacterium AZCC 1564]